MIFLSQMQEKFSGVSVYHLLPKQIALVIVAETCRCLLNVPETDAMSYLHMVSGSSDVESMTSCTIKFS